MGDVCRLQVAMVVVVVMVVIVAVLTTGNRQQKNQKIAIPLRKSSFFKPKS